MTVKIELLMNVSKNFLTISNFNQRKNKRKCWETCNGCGLKWNKTKTQYVHMTINKRNETRFICDSCLNQMQ